MRQEIKDLIVGKIVDAAESNTDNLMSIATLVKNLDRVGDAEIITSLMSAVGEKTSRRVVSQLDTNTKQVWLKTLLESLEANK